MFAQILLQITTSSKKLVQAQSWKTTSSNLVSKTSNNISNTLKWI